MRLPFKQQEKELKFSCSDEGSRVALGVDLKHAPAIRQGDEILLSGQVSNLNDPKAFSETCAWPDSIESLDGVVCDLHPDLHSTALARQLAHRLQTPLIQVQHHYAHILAVMAEHSLEGDVIGLALDGFGYGSDGSAWGGECLRVNRSSFARLGHLKTVPMPGGDAASREPWRMAVAWLNDAELSSQLFPELPVNQVSKLCDSPLTMQTSSAGRLFDAASAIILGHAYASFEGEAAIALEQAAGGMHSMNLLPLKIREGQLDLSQAMTELAKRVLAGEDKAQLAASFHATLAQGFAQMAIHHAGEKAVCDIVLAGGCFLNRILDQTVTLLLEQAGLKVWKSNQVARGDEGIALGQLLFKSD